MSKLTAFLAVLSISLMATNAQNHTITLTSNVNQFSTVTHTHFSENVQESDSLLTMGNHSTETVGVPYNDASFSIYTITEGAQGSNYTFNNPFTSSAASQAAVSAPSSDSDSDSLYSDGSITYTTTKDHTKYSVSNSLVGTVETNSQGDVSSIQETSQSRFVISTSSQTTTVTTKITHLPTTAAVPISTSAPTTTSTIFTASTKPSTTATGSAPSTGVTTGQDPLFSNDVSSQKQETTIATASLTKPVTVSSSSSSSNSNVISSGSAQLGSDSPVSSISADASDSLSSFTMPTPVISTDDYYGSEGAQPNPETESSESYQGVSTDSSPVTSTDSVAPASASISITSYSSGYFNGSSSSVLSSSSITQSSSSLNLTSLSESSLLSSTDLPLSSSISNSLNSSIVSSIVSSSAPLSSSISSAINSSIVSSSASSSSQIITISSGSSILSSTVAATSSSSDSVSAPVSSSTTSTIQTSSPTTTIAAAFDLFSVISTDAPPSILPREPLNVTIPDGVTNDGVPIQTNKFYANLILDDQTDPVWTYPYGMYKFTDNYYGFAVTHTTASQRVFGNYNDDGVAEYYFNPIDLASIVFSAQVFTEDNFSMDVSNMREMSVLVTLFNSQDSPSTNFIDIPLVSGMGFTTATYNGDLTPLLNSNIGFSKLVQETSDALPSGVLKYKVTLTNNVDWLIYVTLPNDSDDFSLSVNGTYAIEGSKAIDGLIIQVAVAPSDNEEYYDDAAGMYVTEVKVEGTSNGESASYNFNYITEGQSSNGVPIVFALPHHLKSFTSSMSSKSTGIWLDSTTKGKMYAYLTNSFQFQDDFTTDVQFLPWSQQMTKDLSYSTEQLQLLASVANEELDVDFTSSTKNLNTYYAGKFLDKYAYILLVIDEIIQDDSVRNSTLERLKDAMEVFINNEQSFTLMYDTKFGGVTPTAAQGGDANADFGAGVYNDHHFHYGYFVHACAVIGMIDNKLGGSWVQDNKDWVNSLVRDVANPSEKDSYFPVFRMFDWFAGHSWAAGLQVAQDGKNEESSSEDYNFAYGMKLWGNVIGDEAMEARGNLMISIMAKAMNDYFLYSDDNDVEPSEIIGNKVSGILFDNKIDHTTWFGSKTEYIQGIHMIPITPVSSVIRGPTFVSEEWDQIISPIIDSVDSGWTGILRLNQALIDPSSSYDFFSQSSWSNNWLDNGLSRTWCLAFSGGLVNAI